MSLSNNITEKTYRKLSLQVSLEGFSYCVFDSLSHRVQETGSVDFSEYPKILKTEDYYQKAFSENEVLEQKFDEVLVLHDSNLNTFVPKALFNENDLGSYLQYNNKVFETDYFAFDEMANQEMNNVYIPYVNINNFLLDRFESFDYRHASTVLVSKLLHLSKNIEEKLFFVYVQKGTFKIIVVENQKLLLFNSFDYVTKEDFVYYLLFSAEQLNLNPENFKLYFLGDINQESELYKIAYKYVRNVDLLDVSDYQNQYSTAENSKHFILFQS